MILDYLHKLRGKLNTWSNDRPAASSSPNASDAKIAGVYRRVLDREPNSDELMHWNVFLGSGASMKQVESSLKASYEHDQMGNRRDVVLVELETFKIYCRYSDLDVGNQIIQTRSFEPHVASALKGILAPGSTFVDLGANIGYFSLMAAALVGPTGRVISFEPNASNLGLFYASVVENRMTNIVVMPVAASQSSEILRLQSFGSNGFLEAAIPGRLGAQYVQAVVLDDILLGVPHIDVFKIDVEGFEPRALRGMLTVIDRHKPILVTEFNPWHIEHRSRVPPREYLDQLVSLGYRLSIIDSSGGVMPATDAPGIMRFWNALENPKMQLDLMARPA